MGVTVYIIRDVLREKLGNGAMATYLFRELMRGLFADFSTDDQVTSVKLASY
jgi:hypothetical protein